MKTKKPLYIFFLFLVVTLSFTFFVLLVNLLNVTYYNNVPFYPIRIIRVAIGLVGIFALIKLLKAISNKILKKMILVLMFLIIPFVILESIFSFLPIYTQNNYSSLSKNWLQLKYHLNSDGVRDIEMIDYLKPDVPHLMIIGDENTLGIGINNMENRFVDIIREEYDECYNVILFGLKNGNVKMAYDIIQSVPFIVSTLIYVHSNDDIIGNTTNFDGLPEIQASNNFFDNNSYLLDYLNEYQSESYDSTFNLINSYYQNHDFVNLHRNTLGGLIHYCNHRSIRLGIVLLPELKNDKYLELSNENMVKPLEEFLTNNAVPKINLSDTLLSIPNRKRKISKFSKYPSKHSHEVIAAKIIDFMLEKSMVSEECVND